MKTLILLLASIAAQAASITLGPGPAAATPGATFTIPIMGVGLGAAAQVTITGTPDIANMSVASSVATKNANCSTFAGNKITCLIINQANATVIPDGQVALLTVTLKSPLTANQTLAPGNALAADPTGTAIPVPIPASLVIPLPVVNPKINCDVDGNGTVNGVDTDLVISDVKAIGQGTLRPVTAKSTDVTKDGTTNVADAQFLLNVVLGLQATCP